MSVRLSSAAFIVAALVFTVRVDAQRHDPNGEKAGFEMARTRTEGGLYGVLRRFGGIQAGQYAQAEIPARVSRFWEDLSASEKLEAEDEYLAEYGHLLPSELTDNEAARVKMDFRKVLAEHPRMMQRLDRIGRG